jgi:hypothetical protein
MKEAERQDATDFEARSKSAFDASVEHLDGRTRSKLTQARTAALAEFERARARRRWLSYTPAAGLTAAVVLSVLVGFWPRDERMSEGGLSFDDFDLVADTESFEMLKDVEFYAWLDEVPEFGEHTG